MAKKTVARIFNKLEDEIHYATLQRRIILLNDTITQGYMGFIIKHLYYLLNQNPKAPIKIVINSPGGIVYDGLFLYNTIREFVIDEGADIITEARGLCASMAAIVLQAGKTRVIHKVAKIMLHEVSSIAMGKTSEMEEEIKEIRRIDNVLRDIMADRTGHTRAEIDKMWTRKDVSFLADEALAYGLVDRIIG